MKIINREEFYKLPSGTLFSEFQPDIFTGLKIKYDTWDAGEKPYDYVELDLIGNIKAYSSDQFDLLMDEAVEGKSTLQLDFESAGRNAYFDEDQLYAIYERDDILGLIQVLQKSLLSTK